MSMSISVKILGDKELITKLNKLGDELQDFTAPMKEIGKILSRFYAGEVFASQGGAIDARWSPLTKATKQFKLKHYPSTATTPLIRTGKMQKSFKYESTKNSVVITNTAPYFKYHQSSAERHKIPYRPMMAVTQDVKDTIKGIIQADVDRKVQAA